MKKITNDKFMLAIYNIITDNKKFPVFEDNDKLFRTQDILYEEVYLEQLHQNELSFNHDFHQKEFGFTLSDIEKNTINTHSEIWNKFAKNNTKYCLIVESGLNTKLDINNIVKLIADAPENFDIIYPYDLQDISCNVKKNQDTTLNINIRELKNIEPYMLGFISGSSIYILSKNGCKILLQMREFKYTLGDEIMDRILNGQLAGFMEKVSWLNTKNLLFYEQLKRNEHLWNCIHKNNSWTDESKELLQDILAKISKVSKKQSIDLLLQGGTHLAFCRHGKIMPWDDDVDLGVNANQFPKLKAAIESMDNLNIDCFIESHTKASYYKIWSSKGEVIDNYKYTFPFIDIWLYDKKGDDIIFHNGIICPNILQKPFLTANFEGSDFKVAYNSLEILDTRYKDWRDKIRIYSWSHRLEQSYYHPMSILIDTDPETGRLIDIKRLNN